MLHSPEKGMSRENEKVEISYMLIQIKRPKLVNREP